jgi:hypothetical protein
MESDPVGGNGDKSRGGQSDTCKGGGWGGGGGGGSPRAQHVLGNNPGSEEEPRNSVTASPSSVGVDQTRLNPGVPVPLPRQINLWQLASLREGTHGNHLCRGEDTYTQCNSCHAAGTGVLYGARMTF